MSWAACGMAAAAIAIGVAEIVAALIGGMSILSAVGALVIALQPPGAKDLMVSLFGENDKLALEIGVFVGGVVVGGLLGLLGRRRVDYAVAGYGVFGLLALLLLQRDPLAGLLESAATAGAAIVAGAGTFVWLSRALAPHPQTPATTAADPAAYAAQAGTTASATSPTGVAIARRGFLAMAAMFVAVGGVLAVIGRYLTTQTPEAIPAAPIDTPAGAGFDIAGITPVVVPNDQFYRIDTRLSIPRIEVDTWSLRIHGMVDREVTLTYADLQRMTMIEQFVTIACVSNEVGGHLVGNALWKGTRLKPVLDMAGVQPRATQLVGRSFDGWTAGFPTAHLDGAGRDAVIALEMNRQPLPAAHGFPARLIVPGIYGYVSATKWITEIELTTLEAFDAYWVPLGWSKEAPILTQSRIDVPRGNSSVGAGNVEVAGVAWAPTRGISKVEVVVDDTNGAWQPAELSVPLSDYSWVQWRAMVNIPGGAHRLWVRATDGNGEIQAAEITPPAPDGARGYHSVKVTAS
jgi:DMSO/TMAO reductase YedYZ molybdopterin-dependent catalytic subunit